MCIKYKFLVLATLFTTILSGACKKLVEVSPPITGVTGANVYNSDATAAAVLTGIYTQLSKAGYTSPGLTALSFFAGLSADEFVLYNGVSNPVQIAYYKNNLSINTGGAEFWISIYPVIFICNSAVEGLNQSSSLTPAVKKQLMGEAKFLRAIFYFYLVNLYGDVPLIISTDYKVNDILPRTSKAQVYQQIISDLKDAQTLLTAFYVDGGAVNITKERVRPNKWAATALLARTYLFMGDYGNAEAEATAIITDSSLYSLDNLNNVFLANSNESVWQLQPVTAGVTNTQDAYLFIIPPTGPDPNSWPVYLSINLLNSFEAGDQRKTNWIDSVTANGITYYYPFKYKVNSLNAPVTEYLMIFRLGEQYLIRAEARAQQGNIAAAQADLDAIRTRAGLPNISANDQPSLLAAIAHERRVELFAEWGHRWLDLKRTKTADAVMSQMTPQKGGVWNINQQLYPLPNFDIQRDINLIQNPGY
jgi:hypothetical protein